MCSAAGFGTGGTCAASPENLAKIEGLISLAVAETNRAYELSGINTKFRLVRTHFDATYNDYTNLWEATLGTTFATMAMVNSTTCMPCET